MPATRSHTRSLLCAAAASVVLALVGAPAASAEPSACSSGTASALPGQASRHSVVRSTLCLLNQERARRGLGGLRLNRRLSRAARRHVSDMVSRDYFSHTSLSGASFVDRIEATGYLRSARSWFVGENLAWGSGEYATSRSIMRAWMNSPAHRANILERRFHEIGIGVVFGAPQSVGDPAATYGTEFGARS